MPTAAAASPRTMLPPAITKATRSPFRSRLARASARALVAASPFGCSLRLLPNLVPGEAAQHEPLTDPVGVRVQQLLDRLVLIPDEGLVQQDDLLVEVLQLALDDPLDDVVRLALGLRGVDLALALEDLARDVVAADVGGVRGGDVHRDVTSQPAELVGHGDEVGLAVQLDEHAELGRQVGVGLVQVGLDDALAGRAARALGDPGLAGLAQDLLGPLEVAIRLLQCPLGVHHACACLVAQGLDLGGRYLHLERCSLSSGRQLGAAASWRSAAGGRHMVMLVDSDVRTVPPRPRWSLARTRRARSRPRARRSRPLWRRPRRRSRSRRFRPLWPRPRSRPPGPHDPSWPRARLAPPGEPPARRRPWWRHPRRTPAARAPTPPAAPRRRGWPRPGRSLPWRPSPHRRPRGAAVPRRRRRRRCGSAGCRPGSRRRCRGSGSRPRRGRRWCRGWPPRGCRACAPR